MKQRKSLIKRLLSYAKKYRLRIFLALLASVIYVVATLYAPYIIGQEMINLFIKNKFTMNDLVNPIIKLSIVIACGCIFGAIMGRLLNVTSYLIIKDLRIDTFNKLLKVPVSYLDNHIHGDILTRVTHDVDQVWDGLLHGFTHLFRGFIAIIITMVFMFTTRYDIALVVVLLTPLSALVAYFIAKFSHKSFKQQADITGMMGGFSNEMITNQKTVIAYNLNEENNQRYQTLDQTLYHVGFKAQFMAASTRPATRFTNAIIYASVAIFGSILIVQDSNNMNVGILAVFLFYASQYTRPFNEISDVASELANSFASLKRVLELIDEEEIKEESALSEIEVKKGEFKISDVSFGYNLNQEILHHLSFNVLENKRVAIVGRTGCGKTTLINLLMRYYDISSGLITLDNQNINKVKRDSLRSNVGLVLQDTWLFKGSVKDNIKYAKLDASDIEIINAAKNANAHDFIMKLKNGYDTIIDDDEMLSTGEKQLISIARLMINLPKVLILDEATSNIDTRTEVQIQKAFERMMEKRTSIIIAHRLSTIKNADLIIVIKDGKIIESGNHDALIKQNGYYCNLYRSLI